MLNRDAAKNAKAQHTKAVEEYTVTLESCELRTMELYNLRRESSQEVVGRVERLVNAVADHPKEFDRSIAEFETELNKFTGVEKDIERKLLDAAVSSSATAGAGFAAGAATARVGPTAAMAEATTFGTASTGTAIASLSGAAATNAALAWLGGGAIAAGGGGMSAGGALLALAGPVGWGLAGVAALGGAGYYAYANGKTATEATEKTVAVDKERHALSLTRAGIDKLLNLTKVHVEGMHTQLAALEGKLPASYADFTSAQLRALGALVNHVQSLSKLLNMTVADVAAMPSQTTEDIVNGPDLVKPAAHASGTGPATEDFQTVTQ